MTQYQDKINRNPSDGKAYLDLGKALENAGQLQEAIACYQRGIELLGDAVHLVYYRNLAEALIEQDKVSPNPV
ncbi:tetratricopeptide repeat protein [Capilliphycus salinus ALCB114379]|uniref:tetratricopeptide repeat protein n=1 Tax=Capilliphycus salinus TaxID=2768948 RepID=UPI0039A691F6